jgi:hypothetical protein
MTGGDTMTRRLTPHPAGLALLALLGCATPDAPASGSDAIGDAGSYAALPILTLEDAGAACVGPEDQCLTTGSDLAAVDTDGSIAFMGPGGRTPQLFLVRATDRLPVALGRNGAGPGEYRLATSLGFGPNGEVRLFDVMQQRLVRYGADGVTRLTSNVAVPDGLFDGDFVGGDLRFLGTEAAATAGDSMPVWIYAGRPGTTAATPLHRTGAKQPSYGLRDFRRMPAPFVAQALFAIDRDGGLIHSSGTSFVVDRYDSLGVLVGRSGFDLPPRAVTDADLAAEKERRSRNLPAPMRAMIEESFRGAATHLPAITGIRALEDGSVWVRESPHAAGDSVSWVVYPDAMTPLGRLVLEADDRILGAHGGRVLVTRGGGAGAGSELRWVRVRTP